MPALQSSRLGFPGFARIFQPMVIIAEKAGTNMYAPGSPSRARNSLIRAANPTSDKPVRRSFLCLSYQRASLMHFDQGLDLPYRARGGAPLLSFTPAKN